MKKILIIEDEYAILELVKMMLETSGYTVFQALDGEQGLDLVHKEKVDLILLDLMLPKRDGYDLLPVFSKKQIPVIILTARNMLMDKVRCLRMGADDYITKPFESAELIARIEAVLRRTRKSEMNYEFDDVSIDFVQRRVFVRDKEVELTPKEFDLLNFFIENKKTVLSREKILNSVWGYEFGGNTRTVDMHVQRLRAKLNTKRIITVYKIGYRFDI